MRPHLNLRWAQLKVGLLLFAGAMVLVFILFIVGSNLKLFAPQYHLRLFVENIEGLVNGSMVTLAGSKVGFVSDIKFTQRGDMHGVEVTLSIDKQYQNTITEQSTAIIRTIGLLGDKYVDISLGREVKTPLKEGDWLKKAPSVDFEKLAARVAESFDDFAETLSNVKDITKQMREKDLSKFVASMNQVMDALTSRKGTAGKIIYDDKLYNDLASIADNLTIVTQNLRRGKGTLGKIATDSTLYVSLNSFATRSDSLVANLTHSGTAAKLLNDDQLYNQLTTLMRDLNALIVDIRNHPDRYLQVKVF